MLLKHAKSVMCFSPNGDILLEMTYLIEKVDFNTDRREVIAQNNEDPYQLLRCSSQIKNTVISNISPTLNGTVVYRESKKPVMYLLTNWFLTDLLRNTSQMPLN